MGFTVSRDFSAPAETVFGTATDLNRWARWLPEQVRLEPVDDDQLQVVWDGGSEQIATSVWREQLRASIHPVERDWSGPLTVRDRPAGGSTAEVAIEGAEGPDPAQVQEALERLAGEVSDNLNVS